jgi:hypothetical protein
MDRAGATNLSFGSSSSAPDRSCAHRSLVAERRSGWKERSHTLATNSYQYQWPHTHTHTLTHSSLTYPASWLITRTVASGVHMREALFACSKLTRHY